jgi:NAD(P)-dependent dehydrogenase (short-subunit alcohol dehydrogenase family)
MSFLEKRLGLAGKFALIVGGGGGLGRASAYDLARAGVKLALADRNREMLDETVETIRKEGGTVSLAEVFDAREPGHLEKFFAQADAANGGRLDVLINVIGGTFRKPFAETTPRGWDTLMRTNFTWLLHATHLAIPRLRATGRGGSIISFTSIEGHRAAPGFSVYAAMKGAIENFTRTLALELAPEQIRVNTVAPDITPTEGMQGLASSSADPRVAAIQERNAIPMGRYGVYEDVGGCVLFLASDLSRYVTGTCIHPDGGTYASAGWLNWPESGYRNMAPEEVVKAMLNK